jgi:hypothetical protein
VIDQEELNEFRKPEFRKYYGRGLAGHVATRPGAPHAASRHAGDLLRSRTRIPPRRTSR